MSIEYGVDYAVVYYRRSIGAKGKKQIIAYLKGQHGVSLVFFRMAA